MALLAKPEVRSFFGVNMGLNKKGITMLEVIVVLVVMGITSVLVVPGVGRIVGRYRLKTAARELSNFMLETRTEAIKNAGSANLDAQTRRFYRVTFDKTNRQYFRQTLQQSLVVGAQWRDTWTNTTSWVLDGQAKTLPYNITISNLVNANEGTASQSGPTEGYYYRPDGTVISDMDETVNGVTSPATPENGYENFDAVVLKIQLESAKGDKYQVTVYSATGLTEIKEGWQ